jgi:hypothetical protein
LTSNCLSGHNSVHFARGTLRWPSVNITKQIKTAHGWRNVALTRDARRRIKWTVGSGRYIIEWRENGRRQRAAAGVTPAEALEAQKRKRLELGAKESGLEISGLEEEDASIPLQKAVETFLKDIKTFRKPLTHQKYEYVLELFAEHAAPKSDARDIAPEDIKKFLAWRKSKGLDPGTTLYTDRVILHNFFNKLGIDNPVKKVPRLPKFRKRPVAYTNAELQKFFGKCDDWERAFFSNIHFTYHTTGAIKNGQMQSGSNKWQATGGTGKFKGINGSGTCTGTGNADGSTTWTCTGTYSFPK